MLLKKLRQKKRKLQRLRFFQKQTKFDLELSGFKAEDKLKVIKEVKQLFGFGLKEAKEIVEKAPVKLKEGMSEEEANDLKNKLEKTGAVILIKQFNKFRFLKTFFDQNDIKN